MPETKTKRETLLVPPRISFVPFEWIFQQQFLSYFIAVKNKLPQRISTKVTFHGIGRLYLQSFSFLHTNLA